ncbi:glycosyltransferase family 4 protein [Geomobilimonas luticola]|uniref:Glycosyltransferase family 4 protein n=1 Tax=Geomobilimonas luticola TaxID=1114878 RepID=A0ABS5SC19_9BACT|nr:glycosyltransferase family 4 protein [Geomobilimonas luticola]MBT0652929.1 glycosyltransferase family 4 protein [Geomobilimonas luticola]
MSHTTTKTLHACFIYYQEFGQLLCREATALQNAGYDIDIICLKSNVTEKIHQSYNGIRLYKIHSRPTAERTVYLYFLRMFLFFLKSTLLLSYLSFKRRYSVVHVTSPPDIAVFTAVVPKLMGAQIILDIHDIGPELYMRKLNVKENHPVIKILKFLERASAKFSDHVITVTHIWRDRLISRSVSPDKCSVLLNVPDVDLFKIYPTNRRDNAEEFNLFYHGTLEEHFGVDTLLEAMPLIKSHIDNVRLHIYGPKRGRLFDKLVSYADKHNMGSFVVFHGGVPFYELPKILVDADIGMVPTKDSVFSDEAVSMKSFEYIFSGIPIVISKTQGHQYYYDDSMVKFFKPCDSADLARSVIELYENKIALAQQVQNTKRFIDQYRWDTYKNVYLQIMNHASGEQEQEGSTSA